MIFRYDRKIVEMAPELFGVLARRPLRRAVSYILNSGFRKATNLYPWLDAQVATAEIDEILAEIPDHEDYDKQALACLKWVRDNIRYIGDVQEWGVDEYWARYNETLLIRSGDCEDGAILLYILCRKKGIPAERLMLFAGDVVGGGHCWLGYKPIEYPLNWVFLDWCYWYQSNDISNRRMFYIDGKSIKGYVLNNHKVTDTYSNYKNIWFAFNEESSHVSLEYVFKR